MTSPTKNFKSKTSQILF